MFSQDSKVAVLESKLNIYEDLSREMLAKLEAAVEKISEGNNRIAQILTKHDERIEQSMKTDSLIIKMIDELKICLLYTSPSPRDRTRSRMPSSA